MAEEIDLLEIGRRCAQAGLLDPNDVYFVRRDEVKALLAAQLAQARELKTKMAERPGWPRIILVGFGGVVGSALLTASALQGDGSLLATAFAAAGGAFATVKASFDAADILKTVRRPDYGPLAYTIYAEREFGDSDEKP